MEDKPIPSCNPDGTYVKGFSYSPNPSTKPTVPYLWNSLWAVLHILMSTWGYLLYAMYPLYIKNNTWFKLQCPTTTWTNLSIAASSEVTGTVTATPSTVGTSTQTAVTGAWNQKSCLNAAPINYWTMQAWTMLIGYGTLVLIWLLNTLLGNDGSVIHTIWFWTFQIAATLLAGLVATFVVLVYFSYGSAS